MHRFLFAHLPYCYFAILLICWVSVLVGCSVTSSKDIRIADIPKLTMASIPPVAVTPEEAPGRLPPGFKLVITDRYKGAPKVTAAGVNKMDWNDKMLVNLGGIELEDTDVDQIAANCMPLMESLVTGVSEQHVGQMMQVAWNLRGPSGKQRSFPDSKLFQGARCKSITTLPNTVVQPTGLTADIKVSKDPELNGKAIAYVCCSLLRLFTKSPENYGKAWDHITGSFYKFYQVNFPLTNFRPSPVVLNQISMMLQTKLIFRNTLAGFLYTFYSVGNDKGLCRMLFEQHVACTGMHSYSLFIRSCAASRLDPEELMQLLDHRFTREPLEAIHTILTDFEDKPAPERALRTWKYARLYDETNFAVLQTRNCKELTCILAYLCENLGIQGNGNILSIAQLVNISEEAKKRYKKAADRIHQYATSGDEATYKNPVFAD
ncbi:N putative nucleocapsid protein [Tree fern varicosa-like virus]|uniref:Nucleoprotein n=1 Tax=Tree fern varicosa-like virus TaxID=2933191 RepID=A0A9C7GXC4_9RHAB|nr:N putative nucleocapsid protein [Tree fern varicosa-like virus]CAI5383996.1 N putative nucleocapsid protein [Tree fern varicosa-like virus]